MLNDVGFMIFEEDLAWDQGPGLITRELLYSRIFIKVQKGTEKLLTYTSGGGQRVPTLTNLIKALYTFTGLVPTTYILN